MKIIFALFLSIVFLFANYSISQEIIELNPWKSIGPNDFPSNPVELDYAGIGPVEFIRVYQKKEGFLLAGSLAGGLFFSDNGGDSWNLTGSDDWNYTGCAWADFHPNDENTWFACSNYAGENGKPGIIGKDGGLLRSTNKGESWQTIGGPANFSTSHYLTIYGTRFNPSEPNVMYVLTSEGLYFSLDCLASSVRWQKVPNVFGLVYDLDFIDESMFVSNFYQNKWDILVFKTGNYGTFETVKSFAEETKPMRNLTFEPQGDKLLIAKDFTTGPDEICLLTANRDSLITLIQNQQIGFGSGHTFAVSPYNPDEFYIGYSTRVKKYLPPYVKSERFGSDYHVDVEFIAYDPFDSLKLYFATHGGVFISKNAGVNWEFKSSNLGISEVMGMSVSKMDPNQIAIGCFHDGSMVHADFDKNGTYSWRTVNGGDGLLTLIDPNNNAIVYTSNQYKGGGLYYSSDTAKKEKINIHNRFNVKTAGWETAIAMEENQPNIIYFNYLETSGFNSGNINVCRTMDVKNGKYADVLSDFNASHKLDSYKVYGLYNSPYHPGVLIAYILDYTKDANGNAIINHRLFRTDIATGNSKDVRSSWYELKHPRNDWIGDVEIDGFNGQQIYLAYSAGNSNPESIFGDRGMVFQLRYNNSANHYLKRQIDISKNIPIGAAGRYNLEYSKQNGGKLFIGTVSGVYYGGKKTMKGRRRWQNIGVDLPHCKVYGLDYNEKFKTLTVGYFGRGVWQYSF